MRKYRFIDGRNEMRVKTLLGILSAPEVTKEDYRDAFYKIGYELGRVVLKDLQDIPDNEVMFSFANEDADWLGIGVMQGGEKNKARVSVYWNERTTVSSNSELHLEDAPIIKSFEEPIENCRVLVIVKSIINTSCVVKTQINRLISHIRPDKILVVAPVMYKDAEKSLSIEFPTAVSTKFSFFSFAVDDEKKGNTIIPGIGGQIYPRLGLGDSVAKNSYMPQLVIKRMMEDI